MEKDSNKVTAAKGTEKSKNLLLGGVGVVAAVMAGYIGLCTMAQTSNNILGNVTINDIPVGGMSKTQAVTAISNSLEDQIQNAMIIYTQDNWNGVLEGNIVMAQVESAVDAAYSLGRDSFITSGASFLAGVTGNQGELSVPLTLNETGRSKFDSLLDEAESTMQGKVIQTSWMVDLDEGVLLVTKGLSGEAINREDAETATMKALSTGNTNHQVTLSMDKTAPTTPNFQQVRDSIYTEPVNAILDAETLEVTAHVSGINIETSVAESMYNNAVEGETFSVPLIITEPEETTDQLRAYLFADVLAKATTKVSGTTTRKANVALATGFIHDTVIMPGENFSFYELCSPYSTSNGYGVATAYVSGQTVDEVAGGICQVASILYFSVLHTGFEVVERRGHQFSSDYFVSASEEGMKAGMDATIYSTSTDFKFKNSSPYPIKILSETSYVGSTQYTTVTIMGTKTDDITIIPKSTTFNHVTPETEYVADESVAIGSQVTKQTAYTGYSATVTLYYYDGSGNLIDQKQIHTDRYNSRPKIVHYNPMDAYSLGLSDVPTDYFDYGFDNGFDGSYTVPEVTVPEVTVPEVTTPEVIPPVTEPEVYIPPEITVPEPEVYIPPVETAPPVDTYVPPVETYVPPVETYVPEVVVTPEMSTIPGM